MRLRTAKNRLKVEHSIIGGLREVLEALLEATPEVRSVIPGVIRPVRDAKGKVRVRVTVPVQNGWKAIALSAGAPGVVHQHRLGTKGIGTGLPGGRSRGGVIRRYRNRTETCIWGLTGNFTQLE